jgi:hypothetical protein
MTRPRRRLPMRHLLLALMLAATAAFVAGVAIERNDTHHHPAAVEATEHAREHATDGEGAPEHETAAHAEATGHDEGSEAHEELRPLGIDVEATPFVVLAAAVSILLALAAWLRPRPALLAAIAALMLAFAALDVREVFHQLDEHRDGLALLAALVAILHLASAAVGALLAGRGDKRAGPAGAITA